MPTCELQSYTCNVDLPIHLHNVLVCAGLLSVSAPSLTSLNGVGEMLSSRVKVDDMNRPLHTLAVLNHSTAVGGLHWELDYRAYISSASSQYLSTASRSNHYLTIPHDGWIFNLTPDALKFVVQHSAGIGLACSQSHSQLSHRSSSWNGACIYIGSNVSVPKIK